MTVLLDLVSNMIANPPATAPASAACHLRVFFRTDMSCACAERDRRARRRANGTSIVVLGKSSDVDWSSISPSQIVDRRKCEDRGSREGKRSGREFIRNLYSETNVPVKNTGC